MIDVSEQYQKAIVGSSREIKAKVKFNGVTLLDDDKVISVSLNEIANSNEKLTIGELNSAKATIRFVMPDSKIPLKNGSFSIQSGLMVNGEYEYVDKGTFYIDTVESGMGSNVVTVSGYDSIYRMNVEYEPQIEYPALLNDVIDDICTQCNIVHDINNIPRVSIDSYQENITCKTFMGYCLGLMGMNGRINEEDELVAYWFEESNFKVTWDNQFQEGFKLTSDEDIKITSVTCNGLSCGSGYGISFENPYMTQELLDAIYKKVNGLIYSPSTVEWRGNPALQISDIIKVEDNKGTFHNVILSEHTITLTGMKDTVTCKGSTDELAMNTSNSPTQLAIKRLYNTLISAFKNTTENILGHNGGYYTVDMNSEGFPSGWTIMDTPTLRDDTKLWRFTSGGLGYSTDGGKTFTKIAFDLEGNFNANVITTGIIQGEMFELDLEKGTVLFGNRDENGEITNPLLHLNEYGELTLNISDKYASKNKFTTIDGKRTLTDCSTQHPLMIERITGESKIVDFNIISLDSYIAVNDEKVAIPTLRSIPSLELSDIYDNGTVVVNIEYAEFSGKISEEWEIQNDEKEFCIKLKKDCVVNGDRQQVLCNRDGNAFVYGSINDNVSKFCYYPSDASIDTVEKFKEWLKLNPIQICYQLGTPEESKLTDSEISDINSTYADDEGNAKIQTNNLLGTIEGYYYTELSSVNMAQSTKPPNNKDVLWCDTSTKPALIKRYNYEIEDWEEIVDTQQIRKWAKYSDGELLLGQNDSPFKMKLTNEKLGFYNDDIEMSYFANERMHISKASIDENIDIANQVRFMYMKSEENEGIGIIPIV